MVFELGVAEPRQQTCGIEQRVRFIQQLLDVMGDLNSFADPAGFRTRFSRSGDSGCAVQHPADFPEMGLDGVFGDLSVHVRDLL